jgi:uncharacterized membrane protein
LLVRLLGVRLPGLGIILTVSIIYLTGLTATNVFGRRFLNLGESILFRLPIIRSIYGPTKQLVVMMTTPGGKGVKRVVLVEYPTPGFWVVGFVTGEVPGDEKTLPQWSIFIPTTPNPTSGMMVILPSRHVQLTGITFEEAVSFVVSGGIVVPPSLRLQR